MPLINRVGGGGADVSGVTATASDVLAPKVIVGADGEPITGTLQKQSKTVAMQTGYSVKTFTPNDECLFKSITVYGSEHVYNVKPESDRKTLNLLNMPLVEYGGIKYISLFVDISEAGSSFTNVIAAVYAMHICMASQENGDYPCWISGVTSNYEPYYSKLGLSDVGTITKSQSNPLVITLNDDFSFLPAYEYRVIVLADSTI